VILRASIVRPRRTRRCVDCERSIATGTECLYVVAQVDGVGFRYGYEHESCARKWNRWPASPSSRVSESGSHSLTDQRTDPTQDTPEEGDHA